MLKIKRYTSILLVIIFLTSSFSTGGLTLFAGQVDNPYINSSINENSDEITTEDKSIESGHDINKDEAVGEVIDHNYAYNRDKSKIIVKYKTNESTVQEKILSNVKTKIRMANANSEGKSKIITKEDTQLNTGTEIDVISTINDLNIEIISIENSDNVEQAIELLEQDENVEYAQPDYTFETLAVPTDPDLSFQWGLKNDGQIINGQAGTKDRDINISPVWEGNYEFDEVIVGVLDTGIDAAHKDLSGKIIQGWDFVNNDDSIFDTGDTAHGTQISGIIAANHNEEGIAGVAPNAKIMPLKFIQDGYGYTTDAIEAIKYARDQGVKIINCSWGSDIYNPALKEIMENNNDILFICAAGNNGSDKQIYPAAFDLPNIISATAIDNTGNLWARSNYGENVNIAAPGADIYTTGLENNYGYVTGTSMAAAYVTGAAALYKGLYENKNSVEIAEAIKEGAKASDALKDKINTNGMLDITSAMNIDKDIDLQRPDEKSNKLPQEVIDILNSSLKYSQLSQAQKDLLEIYLWAKSDKMEFCEQSGFNVANSVDIAAIMHEIDILLLEDFAISLTDAQTIINNYDGMGQIALTEIRNFNELSTKYPILNSFETKQKLVELMIKGYRANNMIYSFIVSKALGVNIDDIIIKYDLFSNEAPLTDEERELEEISFVYSVSIDFLKSYMTEHELTIKELKNIFLEFQLDENMFIYHKNEALAVNDDAGQKQIPNAPMTYMNNSKETISLNTGNLIYEEEIGSIPGVGNNPGIDLKLRYNSSESGRDRIYSTVGNESDPSYQYGVSIHFLVYQKGTRTRLDYDVYDYWIDGYEKAKEAMYLCETQNFVGLLDNHYNIYNDLRTLIYKSYPGIEKEIRVVTFLSCGFSNPSNILVNRTSYLNASIDPGVSMGAGWNLNTERIYYSTDPGSSGWYLQLANGEIYRLKSNPIQSTLWNVVWLPDTYTNLEVYLSTEYTNKMSTKPTYDNSTIGQSWYVLEFKDGTKKYFNQSGRVIAIVDKYGNEIFITYKSGEYKIWSAKTGDTITLNYNTNNYTFILPDNSKIRYDLSYMSGQNSGPKNVVAKTDQANRVTNYSYKTQSYEFDFFPQGGASKGNSIYYLLECVRYPNSSEVIYEYKKSEARIGYSSFYDICQVTRRYDYDGSKRYNEKTYDYYTYATYNTNDYYNYSYYPNFWQVYGLDSCYYTKVTNTLTNVSTEYKFNSDHLLVQEELFDNNVSKQTVKNYYDDEYKRLKKKETKIGYINNTENFKIGAYNILQEYWSPRANGNTGSSEYKTTYTYDSTYRMPLTKEYKKDASTTIKEVYTLTSDKKSIASAKVLVNNVQKSQTDYEYETNGNLKASYEYTDTGKKITTTYKYNGKHILESKTKGGVTESYTYDVMNRLSSVTDDNGYVTKYEYDVFGRQTKITNPDETTIINKYDDINNILTVTNENGVQTKYTYDRVGNIKSIQDIETGDATAYDYDNLMRLTTETDPKGTKTVYIYDYLNRIKSKTVGAALYSESYLFQDGFDANTSKVTKTINGETNAPSLVTAEYADKYGNIIKQSRFNGSAEYSDTFTYDYIGNRVQAINALNQTTKYEYDFASRVTKLTNPDNTVYQTAYDWLGRKTSVTNPKNSVSKYTYNDLSQLTKEEIPFEGSYYTTKTYVYDKNGNVSSQNISNNNPGSTDSFSRTDFEYNNRNWLTKAINFDKNAVENYTEYKYDNIGNKVEMITANGVQSTKYEYNNLNRLTKLTDALNQTETYLYDKNGNLITKTDRNGNVTTNTYDALNRLTEVSVTTPSGKAKEFIKYAYAKTGTKTKEENENLVTTFVYDNLGRLINQKESNGIEKQYGYDLGNNRTSFKLIQNGSTKTNQTYEYDKMNRLAKTYDNGTLSATYTYDLNGNRETLVYPNGLTTTYVYNKANLVTSLTNKKGTSVLSSFGYTYSLDGNQVSKTDSAGRITTYTYDGLGRLTNETETSKDGTLSKSYTYDKANNRATMVVNGIENYTTTYAYDKNNRLQTESKAKEFSTETAEYEYDANGNQLRKMTFSVGGANVNSSLGIYVVGLQRPTPRENYKVEMNEYDVFNRLVGVQNDEGTSVYAYKPDGLRAGTTKKGIMGSTGSEDITITYIWDGSNIVLEYGASNAVYLRGINLIAADKNGAKNYYLYNAHGDVVQIANASGTLIKSYQYDSFGVEIDPDPNDTNVWRYAGEMFDKETGNYYLRARYYDPTVGGFMSEDPIRSGLNFYTYCMGNPVMFVDPTGLEAQMKEIEDIIYVVEAGLGAGGAAAVSGITLATVATGILVVGAFAAVVIAGVLVVNTLSTPVNIEQSDPEAYKRSFNIISETATHITWRDVNGIEHTEEKAILEIRNLRYYDASNTKHGTKDVGNASANPFYNDPKLGHKVLLSAYSTDGKKLYNIWNKRVVVFHDTGKKVYHSFYENDTTKVPKKVLENMRDDGLITNTEYNKLIKGKSIN